MLDLPQNGTILHCVMAERDASVPSKDQAPTVLYHGACPVCGIEIGHYQSYCETASVSIAWSDISNGKQSEALVASGLDREDAKRRMTVIDAQGNLHRGVDAFIVLWEAMPRYRWMAKGVRQPIVYPLAQLIYDRILAPVLYAWNKRAGR